MMGRQLSTRPICVCAYVGMCIYGGVSLHTYTYVCVCLHGCAYACVYLHACAYVCVCACTSHLGLITPRLAAGALSCGFGYGRRFQEAATPVGLTQAAGSEIVTGTWGRRPGQPRALLPACGLQPWPASSQLPASAMCCRARLQPPAKQGRMDMGPPARRLGAQPSPATAIYHCLSLARPSRTGSPVTSTLHGRVGPQRGPGGCRLQQRVPT